MMQDVWSWRRATTSPRGSRPQVTWWIVAVRAHGSGRGSGVPIEISFFTVFEMRDGKVQRLWSYFDEEKALEAAEAAGVGGEWAGSGAVRRVPLRVMNDQEAREFVEMLAAPDPTEPPPCPSADRGTR